MSISEVKISKVPDNLLAMVKKALKDKKKKKKKPSLKKVINNVLPISAIYEAVHVDECSASLTVISSIKIYYHFSFLSYISVLNI